MFPQSHRALRSGRPTTSLPPTPSIRTHTMEQSSNTVAEAVAKQIATEMQTPSAPMPTPQAQASVDLTILPPPTPAQHESLARSTPVSTPRMKRSSSHMSSTPEASKRSRDLLFDALVAGTATPGLSRMISSPDDLDRAELLRCFDILHACGTATLPDAPMATTRKSIEGFLEAVFTDGWGPAANSGQRPVCELNIEADVVAGRICVHPKDHKTIQSCKSSDCTVDITALAAFSTSPPSLAVTFSITDPFSGKTTNICPLTRRDIRWVTDNWAQSLRKTLEIKILTRIHKSNKHLAVWQARRVIKEWASGSVVGIKDKDEPGWGFVGIDAVRTAIGVLGQEK